VFARGLLTARTAVLAATANGQLQMKIITFSLVYDFLLERTRTRAQLIDEFSLLAL
jgi:hypothetical protein